MRGKRSKWIRKLFKNMDPGLILSMNKIFGDDVKKINPKSLYRRAKKMWNNHDPSTKTWGKLMNVKFEKTKTEGATNGG